MEEFPDLVPGVSEVSSGELDDLYSAARQASLDNLSL